jgi:hypothetical protein
VNECRRMDPRSGCEVSRVVPTRWQIVLKGLCSGQSSTSIATIAFDSRSVLRGAYSSLLLHQTRSDADGLGLASLRRFSSFSFALRCLRSRHSGPHLSTIRGMGVANKHIPDNRTNVQPGPIASFMIWTTDTDAAPKRHRTRLNWLNVSTYCLPTRVSFEYEAKASSPLLSRHHPDPQTDRCRR